MITTSGPQETAKTRKSSRTAAQTDPEPIKESITVETEPKDASECEGDVGGTDGFLPSKKTARSPQQAKAQPTTEKKPSQEAPRAPRPPTRVKKFQLSDFAELDDDSDEMNDGAKPTPHQPIKARQLTEILSAIKDMVANLQVSRTNVASKEKILESIAELANALTQ